MNSENGGRYIFTSKSYVDVPSTLEEVDIAFVGECVDDRGSATSDALKKFARNLLSLRFDVNNQQTYLDGNPILRDRIIALVSGKKRILLDATTLGLGEILQVLLAVGRAENLTVEFLYAEPKQYIRRTSENISDRRMRHFSLTQNCQFRSVHGFAHEYEPNMKAAHVFLLGFEPARVQNAIEQRGDFDQERYRCHVVVGVPAFQAGWESNAIRPHLSLLEDLNITERSITYCPANSIREAYFTLWDLYQQLGDEHGCFFISPLGTKPHTVGTALFLLETKGNDIPTSLYYDHPERVKNRSSEVAVWHHVQVTMEK
jgi:hypothetical protein